MRSILSALSTAQVSPDDATLSSLTGVLHYHIGGRATTQDVLQSLDLTDMSRLLDIGCGTGGLVLEAASQYGCHATGIDSTEEYVNVANELLAFPKVNDLIAGRARFQNDNALNLSTVAQNSVDRVSVVHVGMNIESKTALASEIARVATDGARVVIFDMMQGRNYDGALTYPLPFAYDKEDSHVSALSEYVSSFQNSGFDVVQVDDRTAACKQALDRMLTMPPSDMSLSVLMTDFAARVANVRDMFSTEKLGAYQITFTIKKPLECARL